MSSLGMKMHDIVFFSIDALPQRRNVAQIQIITDDERNSLNI